MTIIEIPLKITVDTNNLKELIDFLKWNDGDFIMNLVKYLGWKETVTIEEEPEVIDPETLEVKIPAVYKEIDNPITWQMTLQSFNEEILIEKFCILIEEKIRDQIQQQSNIKKIQFSNSIKQSVRVNIE